jgi:aspartyl-tRNA(Asn)/glutamyl-tRNA(Gln) amidotransferase subunit B
MKEQIITTEDKNITEETYSKKYKATIGIEIHVQLNTTKKIFCYCKNEICSEPNTNICPICCGYPGTLPLFNKDVLESAIKGGIATNCRINTTNMFDRKHYFYADLPKGYQITQNDLPICEDGFVEIKNKDQQTKKIRIRRIHMEEDAGKNLHTEEYGSLVDYNRAGTPLLEIVSYPDITSAEEAALYLKTMHGIMTTLGITSGNMENGAFRADTNISINKIHETEFGTKCELKNINSFKFIKDATEYEIQRQIDIVESGEKVIQQTRLWDTKLKKTYAMRDKETAADYRYLPDPDISIINLLQEDIERIRHSLPELPYNKQQRLMREYGITEDDAIILSDDSLLAEYFEKTYALLPSKIIINWLLRDILGKLKELNIDFSKNQFTPAFFAELMTLLEQKKITPQIAKTILNNTFYPGLSPHEYAMQNNLLITLMNEEQLRSIIQKILLENQDAMNELRAGKMKAKGFLIGKIMAETKGAADPQMIQSIFNELLSV